MLQNPRLQSIKWYYGIQFVFLNSWDIMNFEEILIPDWGLPINFDSTQTRSKLVKRIQIVSLEAEKS